MKYAHPELIDHLASAYVLGTLAGPARRRFERLQRDRADVQLAVAEWQARLGPLSHAVPPQLPSPKVWAAIAARTHPVTLAAKARAPWAGWLRATGFGAAGLIVGAVATTTLLLGAPGLLFTADQVALRTGEKLPASYVGLLTDAQGNGKLLVSSLRHGRTAMLKVIGPITPPATGRLVLWALPTDGPAFVLANVPTSGTALAPMPDTSERLLSKVTRLVVTAETDAAPQTPGTALYSGNCAKLW
jgi:anti-sigma-K factor RskA